jgi:hypothetical protein
MKFKILAAILGSVLFGSSGYCQTDPNLPKPDDAQARANARGTKGCPDCPLSDQSMCLRTGESAGGTGGCATNSGVVRQIEATPVPGTTPNTGASGSADATPEKK